MTSTRTGGMQLMREDEIYAVLPPRVPVTANGEPELTR
jgi:hypothetical protein